MSLLKYWFTGYPHNIGPNWYSADKRKAGVTQVMIYSIEEFENRILENNDMNWGTYISNAAWADGIHPKGNANANVCFHSLFHDLDLEGNIWKSKDGTGIWNRWQRKDATKEEVLAVRSQILIQTLDDARFFVSEMAERGIKTRQTLTGFKGVHIFIDFPQKILPGQIGAEAHRLYFANIVGELEITIDTVNIDAARLCRAPNSIHPVATWFLERPQYCVPISNEDLMRIDSVSDYDEYCARVRDVDFGDTVNPEINLEAFKEPAALIVKNERKHRDAFVARRHSPSQPKAKEFRETYRQQARIDYSIDDLMEYVRPCFRRIFRQGWPTQSHRLRFAVACELYNVGCDDYRVPFKAIHRVFEGLNDYSYESTQYQLEHIGRTNYKCMSCDTIYKEFGDTVCLKECPLRRRVNI